MKEGDIAGITGIAFNYIQGVRLKLEPSALNYELQLLLNGQARSTQAWRSHYSTVFFCCFGTPNYVSESRPGHLLCVQFCCPPKPFASKRSTFKACSNPPVWILRGVPMRQYSFDEGPPQPVLLDATSLKHHAQSGETRVTKRFVER